MRVLLVEDDVSLNEVVCAVLTDFGHEAKCVVDVKGARIAIETLTFDVIVLDWLLGTSTAEELLPLVASLRPGTPTILYSASPDAKRVADAWSIPLLPKPFELDALLAALDDAVARQTIPNAA